MRHHLREGFLGMGVEEGRGPFRPPPASSRVRWRYGAALLVLVLVLTAASFVTLRVGRRGTEPVRATPFEPGLLYGVRPSGALVRVEAPGVLLYVDDACPLCAQELDRWARAFADADTPTLPTVVVSPTSDPAGRHVPAPLRAGMLYDADGTVARALGVRGVPFRARIDDGGAVVAVHVGVSAPGEILALLGQADAASLARGGT